MEEALLRILFGVWAILILTYILLVSGSDPLLTIPGLALLDSGVRSARRISRDTAAVEVRNGGWRESAAKERVAR